MIKDIPIPQETLDTLCQERTGTKTNYVLLLSHRGDGNEFVATFNPPHSPPQAQVGLLPDAKWTAS